MEALDIRRPEEPGPHRTCPPTIHQEQAWQGPVRVLWGRPHQTLYHSSQSPVLPRVSSVSPEHARAAGLRRRDVGFGITRYEDVLMPGTQRQFCLHLCECDAAIGVRDTSEVWRQAAWCVCYVSLQRWVSPDGRMSFSQFLSTRIVAACYVSLSRLRLWLMYDE